MVIKVIPHIFSFKNGLYFVNNGKRKVEHQFLTNEEIKLSKKKYSIFQHYNMDFPIEFLNKNCDDIPTPKFDEMLLFHFNGNKKLIKWIYIFLGRLLHFTNSVDNWHVSPFFIHLNNESESKNAILKFIKYLYNNNKQLSIHDNNTDNNTFKNDFHKPCIVGINIDNKLNIGQNMFESAIYGREIGDRIYWRTPVIMFGKEIPYNFHQATLNMIIPIQMINFKLIKTFDIKSELIPLIIKMNIMYLNIANQYPRKSQFEKIFQSETNIQFMQQSNNYTNNSFFIFLEKYKTHFNSSTNEYISITDFNKLYKKFCFDNSFGMINQNNNLYKLIFNEINILYNTKLHNAVIQIKNSHVEVIQGFPNLR